MITKIKPKIIALALKRKKKKLKINTCILTTYPQKIHAYAVDILLVFVRLTFLGGLIN